MNAGTEKAFKAMNRLAKWRTIFAGWQLGTRSKEDPESQAVRDHREITMCMRAEMNAVLAILVNKGVLTQEEWEKTLAEAADELNEAYEKKFPGAKATDDGMTINVVEAHGWMSKFRP